MGCSTLEDVGYCLDNIVTALSLNEEARHGASYLVIWKKVQLLLLLLLLHCPDQILKWLKNTRMSLLLYPCNSCRTVVLGIQTLPYYCTHTATESTLSIMMRVVMFSSDGGKEVLPFLEATFGAATIISFLAHIGTCCNLINQ